MIVSASMHVHRECSHLISGAGSEICDKLNIENVLYFKNCPIYLKCGSPDLGSATPFSLPPFLRATTVHELLAGGCLIDTLGISSFGAQGNYISPGII